MNYIISRIPHLKKKYRPRNLKKSTSCSVSLRPGILETDQMFKILNCSKKRTPFCRNFIPPQECPLHDLCKNVSNECNTSIKWSLKEHKETYWSHFRNNWYKLKTFQLNVSSSLLRFFELEISVIIVSNVIFCSVEIRYHPDYYSSFPNESSPSSHFHSQPKS